MEKVWYDKDEDVLNIQVSNKDYWKSIELPNGVIIDISKDGSVISVEILNASKALSADAKKVIEAAEPIAA